MSRRTVHLDARHLVAAAIVATALPIAVIAAGLNVAPSTVRRWRAGRHAPPVRALRALACTLAYRSSAPRPELAQSLREAAVSRLLALP